MRLLTLLVLLAILLGLYFYTSETLHVLSVVGRHSLSFVKNVYLDLFEQYEQGAFEEPVRNAQERLRRG